MTATSTARLFTAPILLALAALLPAAPFDDQSGSIAAPSPQRPTLSLSPAVVMVKCKPGQGWTQTLRMSNLTPAVFRFEVDVQDVVVRDGKRVFVPANETPGGIAATAVASPRSIVVAPQETVSVTVTVTVPMNPSHRAVVVFLRGKVETDKPAGGGSVGLAASLGTLMTFDLAQEYKVEAATFSATPQTDTTNLTVTHELVNTGQDVVVLKGSAAILDQAGKRVSKTAFKPARMLPGERLAFDATNPSQLRPGRYRVVSSFEYGDGKLLTASGEFSVP